MVDLPKVERDIVYRRSGKKSNDRRSGSGYAFDGSRNGSTGSGHRFEVERVLRGFLSHVAWSSTASRNIAPDQPLRSAFYRQSLHSRVSEPASSRSASHERARLTSEQCDNFRTLGYVVDGCK